MKAVAGLQDHNTGTDAPIDTDTSGREGEAVMLGLREREGTASGQVQGIIDVLLVDEYSPYLEDLRQILEFESDIRVVGEARDSREAQSQAIRLKPDVILMDHAMLQREADARALLERHPDVNTVALSVYSFGRQAKEALAAGARGYVAKGAGADGIIEAVRAVANGATYIRLQQESARSA